MAEGDFTTVAQVKTYLLQQPNVTTDVGLLADLISGVTAEIVTYLQRDILLNTYTEVRNGTGTGSMILANYPVTAVSSVQVGPPTALRTLNYGTEYIFTQWELKLLCGIFCAGVGNVTVNYTAGYPTLPKDLGNAAAKAVAYRYKQLTRLGEKSKILGQETVQFEVDPWPQDVVATLERYERKFPVPR